MGSSPPSGRSVKYKFKFRARPGGAPSLPRLPLFFRIIAPKSPPGGARQTPPPRPTAPRGSRLLPPARRRSPSPGAPARGHRRVWGLGAGGGVSRVRGSLPSPAVPAAKQAWSDGRSRRGKNPWRGAPAPLVPRPPPGLCCREERPGGRGAAKWRGDWAAPLGLRGARCRSRALVGGLLGLGRGGAGHRARAPCDGLVGSPAFPKGL